MPDSTDRPTLYYEAITEVQSEETPRVVSRPEELTMQVYLDGEWHRRTPDALDTACGCRIVTMIRTLRREVLSEREVEGRPAGKLCDECFTPYEIYRARENDRRLSEQEDREREQWFEEAERRNTARMVKLDKLLEEDTDE